MYYYHDHGRILTIELLPNTRRISFIHKKENYEVLVEDGNRSEKQGYLGWVSTEILLEKNSVDLTFHDSFLGSVHYRITPEDKQELQVLADFFSKQYHVPVPETEEKYRALLAEISWFFDHQPLLSTPEGNYFEAIVSAAEKYEDKHHPMEKIK